MSDEDANHSWFIREWEIPQTIAARRIIDDCIRETWYLEPEDSRPVRQFGKAIAELIGSSDEPKVEIGAMVEAIKRFQNQWNDPKSARERLARLGEK